MVNELSIRILNMAQISFEVQKKSHGAGRVAEYGRKTVGQGSVGDGTIAEFFTDDGLLLEAA